VRNPDADRPPEPHLYLPHAQNPIRAMALVTRTDTDTNTDALTLARPLRQAIWGIDPNQPVYDVRTMDQIVYDDLASSYALIGLMSYFALIALGLAVAGVYSVISYAVSRRSREVGIRMALGARARDVLRMMLKQGLAPVGVGAIIGLAGALGLSKLLSNLVYGISTTDPTTYLGVTLILGAAAFSAALAPAMRAARRDPSHTLRHE
jgi:putative ABC transport system permease protein